MRGAGFEPAKALSYGILSPARLTRFRNPRTFYNWLEKYINLCSIKEINLKDKISFNLMIIWEKTS